MGAVAVKEKTQELTEEEAQELILTYKKTKDMKLRNQLVLHYSYIARSVAVQTQSISYSYAQIEDVVNEGILAIMESLEKFNPEKGASFKSYAFKRVRGAVIDFVRKQDWFPRRVRMNVRNMMEAHDQLCKELFREPTDAEVAQRLGISMETYQKNSVEVANSMLFSLEEVFDNLLPSREPATLNTNEFSTPEDSYAKKELLSTLGQAIESLTERERLVVTLYYYEHMKLSSIAKILNVTDQRVSQISVRSTMKLRAVMEKYMKGE